MARPPDHRRPGDSPIDADADADCAAISRLTLTFDNGPSPETTPSVLDELVARGLRAYFFVVGRQVAPRPRGRRAGPAGCG